MGILLTILLLVLAVGGAFLGGAIVMWLWNWVIVDLFNAPTIGYWLAFGISILLNFLSGLFKTTVNIHKD